MLDGKLRFSSSFDSLFHLHCNKRYSFSWSSLDMRSSTGKMRRSRTVISSASFTVLPCRADIMKQTFAPCSPVKHSSEAGRMRSRNGPSLWSSIVRASCSPRVKALNAGLRFITGSRCQRPCCFFATTRKCL